MRERGGGEEGGGSERGEGEKVSEGVLGPHCRSFVGIHGGGCSTCLRPHWASSSLRCFVLVASCVVLQHDVAADGWHALPFGEW